jgi:hypothetical protein
VSAGLLVPTFSRSRLLALPNWRSIQLALCRTKKAECDLDLSKPEFSKISAAPSAAVLCPAQLTAALAAEVDMERVSASCPLFHSRRATQDNKIRLFVNSLSGAGRPSLKVDKRTDQEVPRGTLSLYFNRTDTASFESPIIMEDTVGVNSPASLSSAIVKHVKRS